MIKATGRSADGTPVLVLGLSGENVARLMAKEPILVSKETMAEMGFPSMHVVIVGGRTEEAIAEELAEHVARLP